MLILEANRTLTNQRAKWWGRKFRLKDGAAGVDTGGEERESKKEKTKKER